MLNRLKAMESNKLKNGKEFTAQEKAIVVTIRNSCALIIIGIFEGEDIII